MLQQTVRKILLSHEVRNYFFVISVTKYKYRGRCRGKNKSKIKKRNSSDLDFKRLHHLGINLLLMAHHINDIVVVKSCSMWIEFNPKLPTKVKLSKTAWHSCCWGAKQLPGTESTVTYSWEACEYLIKTKGKRIWKWNIYVNNREKQLLVYWFGLWSGENKMPLLIWWWFWNSHFYWCRFDRNTRRENAFK